MIFAFVLAVLLFVLPIVAYWIYSENKRKLAKLDGGLNAEEAAVLRAELDRFKERLAVLEEIVTDDRYQLEREFKQLESA